VSRSRQAWFFLWVAFLQRRGDRRRSALGPTAMLYPGAPPSSAPHSAVPAPTEDASAVLEKKKKKAGARALCYSRLLQLSLGPLAPTGRKWSKGCAPDPADLKEVSAERKPGELFRVIKKRIKMTACQALRRRRG